LDKYYKDNGKTMGPLHGLPISLKDQFHVKGNDTTMGYIGWINTYEGNKDEALVHKVNSQVVSELLSLGAVLYCKTSLPQTLLLGETVNNLIGQTLNPNNQNLSCGGSSGGEGALQALRGSVVGFGTDIGGSLRIPAAFNGTFSIKPTHTRLSYRHVANVIPGQTTYGSSVGVMGTSLEAIHLVLRSVIRTEPWLRDPYVTPVPWREDCVRETLARATEKGEANEGKPLKLGIFWTDGVVTPHPPIARGLKLVVDAVKNAGHKVCRLFNFAPIQCAYSGRW
jgi:amidase